MGASRTPKPEPPVRRVVTPPAVADAAFFTEARRLALWHAEYALGVGDDAHDIAQDVCFSLFKAVHTGTFDLSDPLRPWVATAVQHRVQNHLRDERVRDVNEEADPDAEPDERAWADPARQLEANETYALERAAIDALPERQRQVYTMVREDGMKYKAVAAALGIKVNTVNSTLVQAKESVRQTVARLMEGMR